MLSSVARPAAAPQFKTLSRDECESVLLRNNVGRIAFSLHDRVSILPIHYVFQNGWIYGRTASAGKLGQILRNRRIAFEVDEHSQLFDWRSVIVRGAFYLIQPDKTQHPSSVYRTAVAAIRQLLPDALTESDPQFSQKNRFGGSIRYLGDVQNHLVNCVVEAAHSDVEVIKLPVTRRR